MKSPAFQFYPTDYLGSQRVQLMTLEEEGAYFRLMCSCWQHGSIPSDPSIAARLVGKGCSTTVASVVLPMFEVALDEGRLTHDRLERERIKQAEWREKSSAGGKKSAESRKSSKGGSTVVVTVVQPPHQPNGNIPTPFPSSSSSPIPSTTPEVTTKRSAIASHVLEVEIPDSLLTTEFMGVWNDWKHARAQFKMPKNPTAMFSRQLKMLAKYSPEQAIEILNTSICNGWQGLFEPKANGHRSNRTPTPAERSNYLMQGEPTGEGMDGPPGWETSVQPQSATP
jgi:uncharacterized protein YdaU (DUF1376 family)